MKRRGESESFQIGEEQLGGDDLVFGEPEVEREVSAGDGQESETQASTEPPDAEEGREVADQARRPMLGRVAAVTGVVMAIAGAGALVVGSRRASDHPDATNTTGHAGMRAGEPLVRLRDKSQEGPRGHKIAAASRRSPARRDSGGRDGGDRGVRPRSQPSEVAPAAQAASPPAPVSVPAAAPAAAPSPEPTSSVAPASGPAPAPAPAPAHGQEGAGDECPPEFGFEC
jgi:hypothetical protein